MMWKIPCVILWDIAAGFPFMKMTEIKRIVCYVIVFLALDAIHWGLRHSSRS